MGGIDHGVFFKIVFVFHCFFQQCAGYQAAWKYFGKVGDIIEFVEKQGLIGKAAAQEVLPIAGVHKFPLEKKTVI